MSTDHAAVTWRVVALDAAAAVSIVAVSIVLSLPSMRAQGFVPAWYPAFGVGVMAALPLRRWPVYTGVFFVGTLLAYLAAGMTTLDLLVRMPIDLAVIVAAPLLMRRFVRLPLTGVRDAWALAGVAGGISLVRAVGRLATLGASTGTELPAGLLVLATTLTTAVAILVLSPLGVFVTRGIGYRGPVPRGQWASIAIAGAFSVLLVLDFSDVAAAPAWALASVFVVAPAVLLVAAVSSQVTVAVILGVSLFTTMTATSRDVGPFALLDEATGTAGAGEFVALAFMLTLPLGAWLMAGGLAERQRAEAELAAQLERQIDVSEQLRQAEEQYRLMAENASDVVVRFSVDGRIDWVSPSVTGLLGWTPDDLVGCLFDDLVDPAQSDMLEVARHELRTGRSRMSRFRVRCKDGSYRWLAVDGRRVHDESGGVLGGIGGWHDIESEVAAEAALEHAVDFDALTGLANRALAVRRIDEILDSRYASWWALLCVGVDGLTAVNHAFTYAAGDEVLRSVAARLVAAAGAHDRVARVAGDEFVVLLRDLESPADAANAAERLQAAIRGPITVGGHSINVSACVGIAPSTGQDGQDLLRDATAAMRQAARKGPDRWEFLDGNVAEQTRQALAVQSSLRDALATGSVQPWLMPVADLADGRVVGYEALVRWLQADGSVMPPDGFLDVAERSDLILAIDRSMLAQSLDALTLMPADQHLAVNISAASMAAGELVGWVDAELARTHVDPTRLHLEVTETSLLDVTTAVLETMRTLAGRGISWWVDDFGTGYSSISHLRDMPISGLKLDRSFTVGVAEGDSYAIQLASGLAGLARGLELRTVVEGVEREREARILGTQGWQLGQGWLYGRPQPAPMVIG